MKMRYLGLFALAPLASQCQPACTPPPPVPVETTTTVAETTTTEAATTTTTTEAATTTTTTQPPSGPWAPVTDPDLIGVSCGVSSTGPYALLLFQAPETDHNDYTVQVDRLEGDPASETWDWPYLGFNGVPTRGEIMIFSVDWPYNDAGVPAGAMQFTIFNAAGEPVVHEQHTWFEVDAQEPSCSAVWGPVG